MTGTLDSDGIDPTRGRSRSGWSFGLNFIGIVVVGFWLAANGLREHFDWWVYPIGAVALAGWALRELAGSASLRLVAGGVMVVTGAAVAVPTQSLLIVPVIIGVVLLQATLEFPVWLGTVAALVAFVELAVAATIAHVSLVVLWGCGAGLLLGVLIGISRRQFRIAEEQHRRTVEEQQRAAVLAEKSRAARDIHDVLAHSLGGLVIQLDAVEALLEAGRTEDARARAASARSLAADGLAEARRAVATLRDESAEDRAPSAGDLAGLVAAHREFGGRASVTGDLALNDVDAAAAAAVVAVGREALVNARRHAPGRPVAVSVVRDGSAVHVAFTNPVGPDRGAASTGPGGGHGVVGMRERFAELGSGSTIEVGRDGGEFVVAMRVPVRVDDRAGEAR